MIKNKKITGIILVAGNSTRYAQNRNKNFDLINQKPILFYSLKAFEENDNINKIIIAVKEEEKSIVQEIVQNEKIKKKVELVIGGKTRQESVYNCITKTDDDIVIIHDGARPAIKQKYIDKCIQSMSDFKGATIGVKAKDTIKITDENNIVIKTTKRENTWLIQTPQCFDRRLLVEMHEKYKGQDCTDDCMLIERENYPIKILEGDYSNMKVTTYDDIKLIIEYMRKI